MKKLLLFILLATLSAAAQVYSPTYPAITTSGSTVQVPNLYGSFTGSFEELMTGSPATVSVTIQGCMRGNTCDAAADTNTTVAAGAIRFVNFTKAYSYFLVTATWTGGTNPTVTVNPYLTTARFPSSGSGSGTVAASAGAGLAFYPSSGTTVNGDTGIVDNGTGELTFTQGSITTSQPFISHSATWNAAGVAFLNEQTSITCPAAAANSIASSWGVSGNSWQMKYTSANCGTPQLISPNGVLAQPAYTFIGSTTDGFFRSTTGSGGPVVDVSGTAYMAFSGGAVEGGPQIGSGNAYCFSSGSTVPQPNGTSDTCLWRPAINLLTIGNNSSASSGGFFKSTGMTLVVTGADVTCGTSGTLTPCTSFTTITGLTATLPLVSQTWNFECDLIVSQATAAAADQIGVQTASNGATNLSASGVAYTAAGTSTAAAFTGVASTTVAQSIITFTPAATGTKLPVRVTGTIEGASALGTVFNLQVLTGAAGDLLTIYRGSKCLIH